MKRELAGQSFGRWVVLSGARVPDKKHGRYWLCRCDCGREKIVREDGLVKGLSKSCGWHGGPRGHRMSYTKIYKIWTAMRARCRNPAHPKFHVYGGRGIRVCEAWQDFAAFFADMGDSYRPGLSIERIDVNGNYEPANCTWIPVSEQWKNRRWRGLLGKEV